MVIYRSPATYAVTRRVVPALAAAVLTLSACGGGEAKPAAVADAASDPSNEGSGEAATAQMFPDIVDVEMTRDDDETASFDVTVSSPYDSGERYADGWRVLDQDGTVVGEHTLGHDHASEQPFTRTQSGVTIPEGTTELTIEGRDQISGYGGETKTVEW